MSNELPSLPDIAAVALAVGLLFCLRFALAARRLAAERQDPGAGIANGWGVRRLNGFGAEREPERRHAIRQLAVGVVFLLVALALYGWLVIVSVLWPFVVQGELAASTLPAAA